MVHGEVTEGVLAEGFEEEAALHWDHFYQRHQNKLVYGWMGGGLRKCNVLSKLARREPI